MKVINCHRYGSVDVLQMEEQTAPIPSANQVLIENKATSVNPVDWKIRSGKLKIKTGLKPPKIIGSDFAGVVHKVGSNVKDYRIGDEVWGKFDSFKGGAYAQMILASPKNMSLKPNNLNFFEAAAMPNVGLTALQAMLNKANLQSGQSVMINGASGGVGLMALQIAKAMNCEVAAVCSAKNRALVESLGADKVLDYKHDDILQSLNAYDVFFDCVSNQSFFSVKKTLKPAGTHVKTTPDLFSALGVLLKPFKIKRPDHIMVKPNHQDLVQLKDWIENNQLKPIVQQIFKINEMTKAHQLSETGRVVGKLVINLQS
jgi:NADPH:quinone reductase-like Zn-dependent oxidoreductase